MERKIGGSVAARRDASKTWIDAFLRSKKRRSMLFYCSALSSPSNSDGKNHVPHRRGEKGRGIKSQPRPTTLIAHCVLPASYLGVLGTFRTGPRNLCSHFNHYFALLDDLAFHIRRSFHLEEIQRNITGEDFFPLFTR
jgi:hypothetical protein